MQSLLHRPREPRADLPRLTRVALSPPSNTVHYSNNNDEYLERLARTGPKRLHVPYKYILSKFNAYNMNAHTPPHARTCVCEGWGGNKQRDHRNLSHQLKAQPDHQNLSQRLLKEQPDHRNLSQQLKAHNPTTPSRPTRRRLTSCSPRGRPQLTKVNKGHCSSPLLARRLFSSSHLPPVL